MEQETDIVVSPEARQSGALRFVGAEGTHEFLRYFAASAAALAADVATIALLTDVFKLHYLFSGAAAFLVGLVVVYVLSVKWVFSARRVQSPAAEFGMFAVIGIVGLGFNEAVLWIFTGVLGFHYLASKIASVALVFSWNFFARKYLLFSRAARP